MSPIFMYGTSFCSYQRIEHNYERNNSIIDQLTLENGAKPLVRVIFFVIQSSSVTPYFLCINMYITDQTKYTHLTT